MKKFLLAGSALLSLALLGSAAQAADIAPAPAAIYDWTGFYIGANAGVAWNNSKINEDFRANGARINQFSDDVNGDQTAFTGGGILGYNWQMDHIVLGVETDFNYLGFSDDNDRNFNYNFNNTTYGVHTESSFEADWFGTIRGRLGFAADNLLFYGTGGLAYGHMSADGKVKITDGVNTASFSGSTDSTNWGWTAGAGMEYGFDRWSLGVEYLFVDLGSAEWDDNGNGVLNNVFNNSDAKGSVDYQFSVVRATAKLRF